MYYKQILLLLFLFNLNNCENRTYELLSNNCNNNYELNFDNILILNTNIIKNVTVNNNNQFKTCILYFKTTNSDYYILKFNLNKTLCIDNNINLLLKTEDNSNNKSISVVDNKNLCGLFNQTSNYILLNSTNSFSINLSNNIENSFEVVNSIVVSKYVDSG
jgi:hypothetical protein